MSGGYKTKYQYSLADCDVCHKNELKTFRAKRDEWLHWLNNDEYHAISHQITTMLWSDAVFRLVNESRKYANDAAGPYATLSSVVAGALDRGYVAEQIISVRRLLEKASRDPKKQVISLRRLIDAVHDNRKLLTREMFVCHDGLPFDDRDGLDDLPPSDAGVSFAWVDVAGPRAFGMSQLMHRTFDQMMDCAPAHRSRSDQIGDEFFSRIEQALDDAPYDLLRCHANKMLLHAADEFSRGKTSESGVTLNDVWKCHQAILAVVNRISIAIGGSNIRAVPIPQYDILEHWDAPFAPKAAFGSMMDSWNTENELREKWRQELMTR